MNIIDRPQIVQIIKIRVEAEKIKTLYFKYSSDADPGQFFMIWTFNDEIPISISYLSEDLFGITVKEVGEATKYLNSLHEGDEIGVRGPYGNPFKIIENGKILIAGGGIGIAPLMPLIQKLISYQKIKINCVIGAKTVKQLPFLKELQIIQSKFFNLQICTDDGSMGFKGLISDFVANMFSTETFDQIYTCGPEIMIKKIFDIAQIKKVAFQASLERIMKCGIGICGQCVIEPLALRVCKDGPVFNQQQLENLSDFGKYKRDFNGLKYKI